jgi:adenosine deaminase
MTIENFVRAMPKVEVNLRLEGAIDTTALVIIAEQNDVPLNTKPNKALLKLLNQPDFTQLDDLVRRTSKWLQQPEDFTRVVYEAGVSLVKQNVRYAEIGIAPSLYAENGLTFEQLLTALNDGRTRVERAWNVQIRWVLNVFRDEPRKLDDIVRWASSTAAIKGGVVGIGLIGREVRGWAEEFERPFRTAQKKDLSRSVEMLDTPNDMLHVFQQYVPERLVCAANIAENDETMQYASDKQVALNVCMAYSIASGTIASYSDFPLKRLYDDGAKISLGSVLPSLYHSTLVQEYLATVQDVGLSVSEFETIALNAIAASFMAEENKATMTAEFKAEYAQLRTEHEVIADTTA